MRVKVDSLLKRWILAAASRLVPSGRSRRQDPRPDRLDLIAHFANMGRVFCARGDISAEVDA